jgi:hypothetical protein
MPPTSRRSPLITAHSPVRRITGRLHDHQLRHAEQLDLASGGRMPTARSESGKPLSCLNVTIGGADSLGWGIPRAVR